MNSLGGTHSAGVIRRGNLGQTDSEGRPGEDTGRRQAPSKQGEGSSEERSPADTWPSHF